MSENQEPEEREEAVIPRPRLWYALQFVSMILFGLVCYSILSMLASQLTEALYGISLTDLVGGELDPADRNTVYANRIFQIFSSVGLFILGPIIQLAFMRESIPEGAGIRTGISWKHALGAILLIIAVQPLVSMFAEFMWSLHLPESMADLENQLRTMHEEVSEKQTDFLRNSSFGDYIFNLLMMGLLAAFSEELFFRRVGLRLLYDATGNVHVSILISSLLFALIHGQFFYLLPLFLFGVLLGYLAFWSRSLWLPVLAHFLNNALSVSLVYFGNESMMDPEAGDAGLSYGWIAVLISIVFTSLLVYYIYKNRVKD